jgi:hypothetical protein
MLDWSWQTSCLATTVLGFNLSRFFHVGVPESCYGSVEPTQQHQTCHFPIFLKHSSTHLDINWLLFGHIPSIRVCSHWKFVNCAKKLPFFWICIRNHNNYGLTSSWVIGVQLCDVMFCTLLQYLGWKHKTNNTSVSYTKYYGLVNCWNIRWFCRLIQAKGKRTLTKSATQNSSQCHTYHLCQLFIITVLSPCQNFCSMC